jgi:hypothetical protein
MRAFQTGDNQPVHIATEPNQQWSIDFVHDRMAASS